MKHDVREVFMIQNNKTTPLKIYTFKDISEFVFTLAKSKFNLDVDIYYVNNANESHVALKNNEAEIVLMSYDDTLSVMFEDKYDDIVAVMPVHKGILDLCGRIDLLKNTVKIRYIFIKLTR
jgi:hypothetical protein